MDIVKCTYCETKNIVEPGATQCPSCGRNSCLSWIDGLPREVEGGYSVAERSFVSEDRFQIISDSSNTFIVTEKEEHWEVFQITKDSPDSGAKIFLYLENVIEEIEKHIGIKKGYSSFGKLDIWMEFKKNGASKKHSAK